MSRRPVSHPHKQTINYKCKPYKYNLIGSKLMRGDPCKTNAVDALLQALCWRPSETSLSFEEKRTMREMGMKSVFLTRRFPCWHKMQYCHTLHKCVVWNMYCWQPHYHLICNQQVHSNLSKTPAGVKKEINVRHIVLSFLPCMHFSGGNNRRYESQILCCCIPCWHRRKAQNHPD